MSALKHIVLTGATGYIGSQLLKRLLSAGCQVTALSRSRPENSRDSAFRWFSWSQGDVPPEGAFTESGEFQPPSAIIHLAHQWATSVQNSKTSYNDDINVCGTRLLYNTAKKFNVQRFVFASSASSREDALNDYGRIKWSIEQLLDCGGAVSARIGLVYGGQRNGLWGTLSRLVSLSPVILMIGTRVLNQPIHLNDLCDGLIKLAHEKKLNRKIYALADPNPITFGRFLKQIANETFGRPLMVVPISIRFVLTLLNIVDPFIKIPPMIRERINGLAGITTLDSRVDLQDIGLRLRPLDRGLAGERRGLSKVLLREAVVVMTYLTGEKPNAETLRRYVRGVLDHDDGRPVPLPLSARIIPILLVVHEPVTGAKSRLKKRLSLGVKLAETTSRGAAGMYRYGEGGAIKEVLTLALILVLEVLIFPLRLIFGRIGQ